MMSWISATRIATLAMLLPALAGGAVRAELPKEAEKLIGSSAPEWKNPQWLNTAPMTLQGLRGKVVLIRFWTGPHCPYCRPSFPRLNRLYRDYKSKGLVVIGFYHEKAELPLKSAQVEKLGRKWGARFPLAIDPDWATLKAYWLDRVTDAEWTSVSFLIDQKGIIRAVHPGGAINGDDEKDLEKKIGQLLGKR